MKIGIPVAAFHRGNTSEYVLRAFSRLGHDAAILTPEQFCSSLANSSFDLYLCVDSGETIDFSSAELSTPPLTRVGFWFIDYRHHWDGQTRSPGDLANVKLLAERGGWVFQSQLEDLEHCIAHGIKSVSWLPLAADPEVWSDQPNEPKEFDIGFVGNVWDRGRATALEALLNSKTFRFGFFGHGKLWQQDGAKLLRRSRCGFNISSYFGEPWAFDVNMRVFETLSCGVPLVTNEVPSLWKVIPKDAPFIRTYRTIEEILPVVGSALGDQKFLASGSAAREFIEQNGRYELRMEEVVRRIVG